MDPDQWSQISPVDEETSLTVVALAIAALLAILGLLVVVCVRAIRTWVRQLWPH